MLVKTGTPSSVRALEARGELGIETRLGQLHAANKAFKRQVIRRSRRDSRNRQQTGVELSVVPSIQLRHASDAGPVCTRRGRPTSDDRPSGLGFGSSLLAFTTHHPLAPTTSFDDGLKISAAERARRCVIEVERGYRGSKSCKGGIERHPGQSCFWVDQRPSPHNQSK